VDRHLRWVTLFIPLLILCLSYAFPLISASNETSNIAETVQQLIHKYRLSRALVGIKIVAVSLSSHSSKIEKGKEDCRLIYEKNTDILLIPASNLKLFPTAATLCLLGPEFKYTTTLYYAGVITDSILRGNLIVRGDGDPNISGRFYEGRTTAILEDWADKIKASGIRQIAGDIVLDDTAFDRVYCAPTWPQNQLNYWYCAPVSALSFNDNCIDITVYPDKGNQRVEYQIDPLTSYVKIVNQCRLVSKKTKHLISFYRPIGQNTISLKGKCWTQAQPYKESITIDNPTRYFGTVLKEVLEKAGIRITGEIKLIDSGDAQASPQDRLVEIISYHSALTPTLTVANKRSQNFYAEQLTKTLGYKCKGLGSWENGLAVIREFLQTEVKIPPDTYTLCDGSGLSRQNKVTAGQIAQLLIYMARHRYFELFRDSLSIAGVDGGLAGRLTTPLYQGKVFAKTGYLQGVSALSGYMRASDDTLYVFSIIINRANDNGNAKQFQDELLKALPGQ
jgi:D-alanyl-D-alanine carboxypeptidase/D-alanyl-D-alanine-endopeptidase (penicillin-binding protein 4)